MARHNRSTATRRAMKLAISASLLVSLIGCSPNDTGGEPRASSTADASQQSTNGQPSPSETSPPPPGAADRTKAEQAYRDGFAEATRIQKKGGATKPTPELRRTMSGDYLKLNLEGIAPGMTGAGQLRVGVVVSEMNSKRDRARLIGCEDWSNFKVVDDKSGKESWDPASRYLIQHMKAVKGRDGLWRIAELTSTDAVPKPDWLRSSCVRRGDVR